MNSDARRALAQITVPLLYVDATEDHLLADSCLEEMKLIKSDMLVAQVAGPHLLLQREPQKVAHIVSADANYPLPDTGETPLHAALCTTKRLTHNLVMKVLLAHDANPNVATKEGVETSGFMRDVRTTGETPLHRAGAFGDEESIQMLLDAGAKIDAKDMHGDSPLSWASWHLRPVSILRKLCYGDFRIRPDYTGMEANLEGRPGMSR